MRPDPELKAAYAALLRETTRLLTSWKAGLPTERRRELDAFEDKGLEVGLLIGTQSITVTLRDPAGEVRVLGEISLAGV